MKKQGNSNINLEEIKIEKEIMENSKSIEYYTSEYTIEVLIQKLKNGYIYIPEYQRKSVWDNKRKNRFIESILIGLPIPFLFFWENPQTGKLEIVDGVQRLQTVTDFYNGKFSLSDLEKIPSANKLTFLDLFESRKQKFLNTSIRGIMLSSKVDSNARFDLFERINSGSKHVEPAELRRGILQGKFYTLVEELSLNDVFIELTSNISQQKVNQGEREELVSRFFAYSHDLINYKGSVKNFIFTYIKKMNAEDFNIETYKQDFLEIINLIKANAQNAFKSKNGKISRTRFESITIGLYLAIRESPDIKNKITSSSMDKLLHDAEFDLAVTTDGANTPSKLKHRINFTKEFLLELNL